MKTEKELIAKQIIMYLESCDEVIEDCKDCGKPKVIKKRESYEDKIKTIVEMIGGE